MSLELFILFLLIECKLFSFDCSDISNIFLPMLFLVFSLVGAQYKEEPEPESNEPKLDVPWNYSRPWEAQLDWKMDSCKTQDRSPSPESAAKEITDKASSVPEDASSGFEDEEKNGSPVYGPKPPRTRSAELWGRKPWRSGTPDFSDGNRRRRLRADQSAFSSLRYRRRKRWPLPLACRDFARPALGVGPRPRSSAWPWSFFSQVKLRSSAI